VALVEASLRDGLRLLSNDEEERFTGIKHYDGFPSQSVEVFRRRLRHLGLTPADIGAFLTSWNYPASLALGVRTVVEHLPASLTLLRPSAAQTGNFGHILAAFGAPRRLARQLGLERSVPLVGLNHHDSHAAFSWAVSPFNHSDRPVLISVVDGYGDEGSISFYLAEKGEMRCIWKNFSLFDSIGLFYAVISSTQGGWTPLSSEGRYMGAAAWGNNDRLTNPYYRMLREIFHFGPEGDIRINRRLANWVRGGEIRPYTGALEKILGPAIPRDRMWNPDAVLRVDDVEHSATTRERVDKAAATQMVFEDALFHVLDHFLRVTGCDRLVLTGGTALNCLANMRLVEHFDRTWYQRTLGRNT
jgi:carbamoyltransferase